MQFESGHLYHIYNQGNNRQKIFFERDNYLFFLKKIRTYILPYGDIIAWCLMTNHFHLMVLVRDTSVSVAHSDTDAVHIRTLNDSIGIMLRSYTSAINKQQERTGSLFREKTKAECIDCTKLSPSYITEDGVTKIDTTPVENQYPQACFNYIHQNPVKAHLVKTAEKWEFSSAIDYLGLRDGDLINKDIAGKYINYFKPL